MRYLFDQVQVGFCWKNTIVSEAQVHYQNAIHHICQYRLLQMIMPMCSSSTFESMTRKPCTDPDSRLFYIFGLSSRDVSVMGKWIVTLACK